MAATPNPLFSLGDTINQWLGLGETAEGRAQQEQKRAELNKLRDRILQNPKGDFLETVNALRGYGRDQSELDLRTSKAKSDIGVDTAYRMMPVRTGIDDNTSKNKINEIGAQAQGDLTRLTGLADTQGRILDKSANLDRDIYSMQQATVRDAFAKQYQANQDVIAFNRELLDRQSGFKVKDLIGTLLAGASLFV